MNVGSRTDGRAKVSVNSRQTERFAPNCGIGATFGWGALAASVEEIEKAIDRDKFLESDEAKAFGIIDEVFDARPDAGDAARARGCHAGVGRFR